MPRTFGTFEVQVFKWVGGGGGGEMVAGIQISSGVWADGIKRLNMIESGFGKAK